MAMLAKCSPENAKRDSLANKSVKPETRVCHLVNSLRRSRKQRRKDLRSGGNELSEKNMFKELDGLYSGLLDQLGSIKLLTTTIAKNNDNNDDAIIINNQEGTKALNVLVTEQTQTQTRIEELMIILHSYKSICSSNYSYGSNAESIAASDQVGYASSNYTDYNDKLESIGDYTRLCCWNEQLNGVTTNSLLNLIGSEQNENQRDKVEDMLDDIGDDITAELSETCEEEF